MRAYTADTITKQNVSFTGVGSISGHNYVGGIAGSLGTASVAGLLNTTLGVASYLAFTVDSVTLNGAADAFAVSGTERVGGGFGEAIGGSVTNVSVNNLASVTGENLVGGFIGLSGPGELVGSDGGLTVNLLGLNYLLKLNNLLSLGQAVEVTITNANVNGIKSGFTVEATGAREENSVRDYTASGFMARSNSTKAEDAHVTNLKSVTAANDGGYAAGFVAISKTGGLAEVGDDNSVKSLLEANELVNAIGYLIPSYTTRKTDAMLVNVPSDRAATLQLKSEYPSVEKKVDTNKTESSAQIGQKVNFTLTSKVPDMSEFDTYYFAFKDTMSKGLTFDESSVTVTIGEQTLTKDTDFTVTTAKDTTTGATNITIEILDMKTKYADKADKAITVTYSATLNKDAVVGIEGNKNEAKVEYQNGPATDNHGTSNPSITTTRTYPVKVQKHAFEDTADTTSVLAGAKFALSTSEAVPTFTKGVDGSYTLDTSDTNVVRLVGSDATYRVAEKNDEAGAVTYFTTVSTSATTINGLKAGIYYLHEIEAPEGYNKLTAPVKVEIIETKDETSGNVTSVTYKVNDGTASDDSNVKIDNKTGSMLPSTGGMGTIGLTVLGVGVVALGVLAPKKKKEKQ